MRRPMLAGRRDRIGRFPTSHGPSRTSMVYRPQSVVGRPHSTNSPRRQFVESVSEARWGSRRWLAAGYPLFVSCRSRIRGGPADYSTNGPLATAATISRMFLNFWRRTLELQMAWSEQVVDAVAQL